MSISQNTQSRNGILLAVVAALALQIPLTIASIEPSWLRAVFQVSILLMIIALSIKVNIPETIPKPGPVPEPDTLRDPPRRA